MIYFLLFIGLTISADQFNHRSKLTEETFINCMESTVLISEMMNKCSESPYKTFEEGIFKDCMTNVDPQEWDDSEEQLIDLRSYCEDSED